MYVLYMHTYCHPSMGSHTWNCLLYLGRMKVVVKPRTTLFPSAPSRAPLQFLRGFGGVSLRKHSNLVQFIKRCRHTIYNKWKTSVSKFRSPHLDPVLAVYWFKVHRYDPLASCFGAKPHITALCKIAFGLDAGASASTSIHTSRTVMT